MTQDARWPEMQDDPRCKMTQDARLPKMQDDPRWALLTRNHRGCIPDHDLWIMIPDESESLRMDLWWSLVSKAYDPSWFAILHDESLMATNHPGSWSTLISNPDRPGSWSLIVTNPESRALDWSRVQSLSQHGHGRRCQTRSWRKEHTHAWEVWL